MTLYVIQIKFNFRIYLSFFLQYSSKCKAKVVVYRKGGKLKKIIMAGDIIKTALILLKYQYL